MIDQPVFLKFVSLIIILAGASLMGGCGEQTASLPKTATANEKTRPASATASEPSVTADQHQPPGRRYTIDNTRYLFVVAEHPVGELQALLQRADDIARTSRDQFDQLDIVLVIHGPNIDLFTQRNYEKNKQLIDLAARLDAARVLDLKMCETSMRHYGISREQVPSFIEAVPYAPDEIKRLDEAGYINL